MPPPVTQTPEQIANYFPQLNEYMQKVLSEYYLGEGNPYTAQLIQSLEEDARRNYETSIVPLQRSALAESGSYGTALGAQAEGRTAEDFNRALMGTIAQTRTGLYESERDRMMDALQLYSGETVGARQGLEGMRGQDIGLLQTKEQAAASRFGSSAAAGASRYGSNLNYQLGRQNLQYNYWRDLMDRNAQQNYYNAYGGGTVPGSPAPQAPSIGVPRPLDPNAGLTGGASLARGAGTYF